MRLLEALYCHRNSPFSRLLLYHNLVLEGGPNFRWQYKQWYLQDIINELKPYFPHIDLYCHFENTSMKPDGGILAIKSSKENNLTYPILISEVKNQGQTVYRQKKVYADKHRETLLNVLEKT